MRMLLWSALCVQVAAHWRRDGWTPEPSAFRLGDGKSEGVKVVGYEGEWPLWSDFRAQQDKLRADQLASSDAVFVCVPIGDCSACPDDVVRTRAPSLPSSH